MYEYRKMTPEERTQVLLARRVRGMPLHAPPHPNQVAGDYFITAACYEHHRIFDSLDELSWLAETMLTAFEEHEITCLGWVFMPNHYHVLVRVAEFAPVSELLRKKHSRISTMINSRQGMRGRQVWYRFMDRKIKNEPHYWATVNYIHYNPVKHGFIDDMLAWPWSSMHQYYEKLGEEEMARIREKYPILNYGKGWD